MELALPMYNVHPYSSLKNLGKKAHLIHGKNTEFLLCCTAEAGGGFLFHIEH